MPGKTGKRARPAGNCTICGKPIGPSFLRFARGDDRHIDCEYPKGPNGPTWSSTRPKGFPGGWTLEIRNDEDDLVEFMELGGRDFNDPAVVAELVAWLQDRQSSGR